MVLNGSVTKYMYRCKYCEREYFDKREFTRHKRQNHPDQISVLASSDSASTGTSERSVSLPPSKNNKRKHQSEDTIDMFSDPASPEAEPIPSESDTVASGEGTGEIISGSSALEEESVQGDVTITPQNPQPTLPTPAENSAIENSASCGHRKKRKKNMPLKIGNRPSPSDDEDESGLFMHNPKFAGG